LTLSSLEQGFNHFKVSRADRLISSILMPVCSLRSEPTPTTISEEVS
jgi:hypothetical protein